MRVICGFVNDRTCSIFFLCIGTDGKAAFKTIFTCGLFPAGGDAMYDAVSVGVATWLIAIPLSLFGLFVWNWPIIAVYVVMCMDEIIKVPVLYWYSNKYVWLKNLTRE